jgi:hypothetical protein
MATYERPVRPCSHLPASPVLPLCHLWRPTLNGRTVVATVNVQWTPLVAERRHKGGRREAEGRQKHRPEIYPATIGQPPCLHSATTAMAVPPFCLPSAFLLPPLRNQQPWRPLCDRFEHVQNFTATMASMAMSVPPVCHLGTTKATILPPLSVQRRPGNFFGRTREAERSQALCKGPLTVCAKFACATIKKADAPK